MIFTSSKLTNNYYFCLLWEDWFYVKCLVHIFVYDISVCWPYHCLVHVSSSLVWSLFSLWHKNCLYWLWKYSTVCYIVTFSFGKILVHFSCFVRSHQNNKILMKPIESYSVIKIFLPEFFCCYGHFQQLLKQIAIGSEVSPLFVNSKQHVCLISYLSK